ncbi:MAG: hypothetical protein KIT86_07015 [Hydrogenophaga sp.]|uniref:hypothetical protein n=1 Tax=Hydrogenophaga sp. TaxID=1904254 RepID=UPI002628A934|nr:hypothetical protein [Hydrogenophaga sp.]MCW5669395.1 hypothetical protein [Hydrogenophaga sp.]
METILTNLSDPAWWFTAFFPAIAILLVPRLWRYCAPKIRRLFRGSRSRSLRRTRELRKDDLLLSKEMLSAQAAFFVFIMFVAVGLVLLVLSPLSIRPGVNSMFVFVLSVPILTSEVIWLLKDVRVQELLKYRRRWLAGRRLALSRDCN